MRGRQTAASRAKAATLKTLKRDLGKEKIGHLDRQELIDYAPEPSTETDAVCFLPVEIVDRPIHDDGRAAASPAPAAGTIEIDRAGGHRLRISGAYDPEALARLIRGLSA